jgi:DNA replication protein DnaC
MADTLSSIKDCANYLGIKIETDELACFMEKNDIGIDGAKVLDSVFKYLSEKKHAGTIETLLRLSRLPRKEPKTFQGFDFSRMGGRDIASLKNLPALTNLYARKNIAFIGPEGIGKTHLAQAYGRECCLNGYAAYFIKATELNDKLKKACESRDPSRCVRALVKPSCLIVDEIGRCRFDSRCTELFFDVVDRRYEKEGPNTILLTSNTPVNEWNRFFTGEDTMLCTLDRIFDKASVFVMKGGSYRGKGCETLTVEAAPSIIKSTK